MAAEVTRHGLAPAGWLTAWDCRGAAAPPREVTRAARGLTFLDWPLPRPLATEALQRLQRAGITTWEFDAALELRPEEAAWRARLADALSWEALDRQAMTLCASGGTLGLARVDPRTRLAHFHDSYLAPRLADTSNILEGTALSPRLVSAQLDRLLETLQTSYLDLFVLKLPKGWSTGASPPDFFGHLGATLRTLEDATRAGTLRAWGLHLPDGQAALEPLGLLSSAFLDLLEELGDASTTGHHLRALRLPGRALAPDEAPGSALDGGGLRRAGVGPFSAGPFRFTPTTTLLPLSLVPHHLAELVGPRRPVTGREARRPIRALWVHPDHDGWISYGRQSALVAEGLRSLDVECLRHPFDGNQERDALDAPTLAQLVRQVSADLVVVFDHYWGVQRRLELGRLPVPTIVWQQEHRPCQAWEQLEYGRTVQGAWIVPITEPARLALQGYVPVLETIPHGVDTATFRPWRAGQRKGARGRSPWQRPFGPVFGCVARNSWEKQLPRLLEAFAQTLHRFPGSRLLLRTEKQHIWDIPLLARTLQVEDQLWLRDETLDGERMAELYNQMDVFVLPTCFDGFGLPLIEAMACGLPVICTDYENGRYIVGDDGLFIPAVSHESYHLADVNALSVLMQQLIIDPDSRIRHAKRCLRRSKEFSIEKVSIKWRNACDFVLNNDKKSRRITDR